MNREQLFYIYYEGWNRKYDEYIYKSSGRLAPLGTYTNRTDIPKYQMCPHQNMLFSQILPGGENQPLPIINNQNINPVNANPPEQIPEQAQEEEAAEDEEHEREEG
mmetsp:Transcript_9972/g.7502  ORF Transcript_9972/g.7502 Transcript_9972/m.7502 type:complete len:106 (+) Transcript_9972:939-1256(+)|eukprot:CAMPEP_0202961068 /NCGR_PEP_ID=MMETSP1396-20130829/5159_1 /ASSEMBLY_ACC=CAM_ASM_000872 /TAXON_ID= /ORGANISM="Pseudokeronopsis sp., Strain Brazil" /LENGTH=105 /DNA_ID=CAMNT_0049680661 /DNA_START=931 /DNA_END=1248 /DNA_ORIENTATION=+